MPSIDPNHCFTVYFEITEDIPEDVVYIQVEFQYMNSQNEK